MTMAELYQDMKDALAFLGLSFHQMDLVEVTIQGQCVVFSYGGRSTSVALPEKS
jgi:hypothetical protein